MDGMKAMARPFGVLFAVALIVAALGRIGLGIAAATGILAFDYISASGVGMLDVVCSILTGSALVAFLFAAGLVLALSAAMPLLCGFLQWRGVAGAGRPLTSFLWGWATALVAIVCLLVVMSGVFSAVQVASVSSKLPALPVLAAELVLFAALIGTLLGAAAQAVCACTVRAQVGKSFGVGLIAVSALCGLPVMAVTVGTVGAVSATPVNAAAAGGWLAACLAVNLIILALATRAMQKAGKEA